MTISLKTSKPHCYHVTIGYQPKVINRQQRDKKKSAMFQALP